MAGLLARLKSAFSQNSGGAAKHYEIEDGIPLAEPSTVSMAAASRGFYRSLFGQARGVDSLSLPQKLILDVVTQNMANRDQRIKAVPRLPSIIPKLLQTLRDSNSASKDYVNIINKDPAMSAAVLKLANSVYFNPIKKRITSIEVAVVKLGIDGLRSVLSAAVMQPVIECRSQFFANFGHKLWEHSLSVAVGCELVAKRRGLEPYKAYLLGLMHDMGKITLFSELCQQFKLNPNPLDSEQPGYAAFAPLMENLSPALSHSIAEDWQLPEEICSALQQQNELTVGQPLGAYAHLLFQVNLACELYFSLREAPEQDQPILQRAADKALAEMALPADLFQQLDELSIEVR